MTTGDAILQLKRASLDSVKGVQAVADQADRLVKSFEGELDRLGRQITDREAALQGLQIQVDGLEKELAEARGAIAKEKVATLEGAKAQAEAEAAARLELARGEIKKAEAAARKDLKELGDQRETLAAQVSAIQETLDALQVKVGAEEARLAELLEAATNAEERQAKAQARLDKLAGDIGSLRQG